MSTSRNINKNDSEASGKLLAIMDSEELVITNAEVSTSNGQTITIGQVNYFNQNGLTATLTEYVEGSLMLAIEAGDTIIPLSSSNSLLELNPVFNTLYEDLNFTSISLHANVTNGPSILDQLTLRGVATPSTSLSHDFLGIEGLPLTELELFAIISAEDKKVGASILAKLSIGGKEIQIALNLPVNKSELWNLKLMIPGLDFGLSDLEKVIMGSDAFEKLPPQIKSIPGFNLDQLEIAFNPSQKTVHSVGLRVNSSGEWVLIPGSGSKPMLTLKDLGFQLSLFRSNDGFAYNGEIHATAHFGDFDITVMIPLPWTGKLSLYSTMTKPLHSLGVFSELLADTDYDKLVSSGNFEDEFILEIKNLGLELDTTNDSPVTYFILEGGSSLKLTLAKFSVYLGCDFELTRLHSEEGGAFQVRINATTRISIDEITLTLTGQYDSAEQSWLLAGKTVNQNSLTIEKIITDLAGKFDVSTTLPAPLAGLVVKDIEASFNTKNQDFTFSCEGHFPIEGKEVDITLKIMVSKLDTGSYKKELEGIIKLGPFNESGILEFNLHILDSDATFFAATFSQKNTPLDIKLSTIIAALSSNIDDIPVDLSAELKDIILVFEKKQNESSKFLFALDIGASVNLSHLPLIGKLFPPDKSVGFENLQFLLASAAIPKTDIELWGNEKLLPDTVTPIPTRDLSKGLGIDGKLNLGPLETPVSLPLTGPDPTPAPSSPPQTVTPPSASDKAKWFTVQKKIGPIDFERVGLQYTSGELWFLLDASLSAGGLTIDLQGLSARSSLKRFDPKFSLNGLGIDFKRGPLEIGGAFLKVPNAGDNVQYEYDGTAIIKTEELMLAAIGSYAALADGHKSLFIYAVLDYPLGGPAFFFVTGLAAGFGYNRRLITPAIDQVASFPLVSEAMNGATPIPSGTGSREALSAELAKIRTYIPPEEDQYFFAVGIKFNSFKMIDSFALLTVSFGHHFELDLLGLSTLLLPTPEAGSSVEPLAEVQLALKASFIPDEGFLGVEAQLTTASFLLSRKCHLTGGFAFFSWFSGPHGGDFVISVGGYHPSFQKPAHYPSVPRVGFNWQVTDQLSLKGGAYFALTASAVMAGGRLQALWDDGNLKAWFVAGADFLIAWKPYHYDARIYVDLGVSYTFHFFGTHTISVDIGADLHIWGPDFSGTAHVKLWIISFTVSFGAGSSQAPRPINWTQFRTSFLPAANKDILSIALKGGLKKQVDAGNVDWIVDPKGLAFEVDSILPVKQVSLGAAAQKSSGQEAFGISPMGLNRSKVESTLKITITDKDPSTTAPQQLNDYTDKFSLVPIKKNVPKGMWGESVSPNLNGQKFITGAVTGYRIVLNAQEEEPTTKPDPIDRHKFEFSTKDMNGYIDQKVTSAFTPNYPEDWRNQLKQDLKSNSTRDTILTALGLTSESDSELVDSYVDELIFSPQFKGQAV